MNDPFVQIAVAFLSKMDLSHLKNRIEGLVKKERFRIRNGKVFLKDSAPFTVGGIVSDGVMDDRNRAWQMLEPALHEVDPGMFWFLRDGLLKAFIMFCNEGDVVDLESFNSKYKRFFEFMESGFSNENGIMFSRSSHRNVFDLRHINMSDCEKAGIMDDINNILITTLAREMVFYNRRRGNKIKILPCFLPYKTMIGPLSDCIHPIAIATMMPKMENSRQGLIIFNRNFVKMLYVFRGLKGEKGDIPDCPERDAGLKQQIEHSVKTTKTAKKKKLGNIYESILHSIAIFLLRGAFRLEFRGITLNTDRRWAQGERGRGHRYVNVLSMLFFWFAAVENSLMPSEDSVRVFLEQHKPFTRGLEERELEKLPRHLVALFHVFQIGAKDSPLSVFPRRLMRRDPTPSSIFLLLLKQFETRQWQPRPVSVKEMVSSFKDPDSNMFCRNLATLVKAGVVVVSEPDGPGVKTSAKVCSPTHERGGKAGEIRRIVAGFKYGAEEVTLLRWKTEALEIADIKWVQHFRELAMTGLYAKKLRDTGEEMLIAIETDWFPKFQKTFGREMVRKISKIDGLMFVTGSAAELPFRLREIALHQKIRWKHVTVLAGRDTIYSRELLHIREFFDKGNEALFTAVDARHLRSNSNIPLMAMLVMAMEATRYWWKPKHPGMEIWETRNNRTYIFEPRAGRVKFIELKGIYDAQRKALSEANISSVMGVNEP